MITIRILLLGVWRKLIMDKIYRVLLGPDMLVLVAVAVFVGLVGLLFIGYGVFDEERNNNSKSSKKEADDEKKKDINGGR